MRMVLLIGLLAFAFRAESGARWHWESRFSAPEKAGLTAWIEHTIGGMEALIGPAPGTFDVHFHRSQDRSEAVPWGETNKGGGRHAHFFVDTDYPWSDFRKDWTASHELAHLLFPYLGEDSRWFSEGIASYLQYQIMYAQGVLTWPEALARYERSFGVARSEAKGSMSVVQRSREGASRAYIPIYWGGAAFFLYADRRLQERRGLRLNDVIRRYSDCCFQPWGIDSDGMIREFDRLSGSEVFSESLAATVSLPGFPATADGLQWLLHNPPRRIDRPRADP